MVDNATAVQFYNTVMQHIQNRNSDIGGYIAAGIMGAMLGGLIITLLVDNSMKQLRIDGRKVTRRGVYTFVEHTTDTMKEYLEKKKKEKQLS